MLRYWLLIFWTCCFSHISTHPTVCFFQPAFPQLPNEDAVGECDKRLTRTSYILCSFLLCIACHFIKESNWSVQIFCSGKSMLNILNIFLSFMYLEIIWKCYMTFPETTGLTGSQFFSSFFMPFLRIRKTLAFFSHQHLLSIATILHKWQTEAHPATLANTFSILKCILSGPVDLIAWRSSKWCLLCSFLTLGCPSPYQAVSILTEVWSTLCLWKLIQRRLCALQPFPNCWRVGCLLHPAVDLHFPWPSFCYWHTCGFPSSYYYSTLS